MASDPIYNVLLPNELTIRHLNELTNLLDVALQNNRHVKVDASSVEKADTAALQMFVSFFQEARLQGVATELCSPSSAFEQAAIKLGLETEFAL